MRTKLVPRLYSEDGRDPGRGHGQDARAVGDDMTVGNGLDEGVASDRCVLLGPLGLLRVDSASIDGVSDVVGALSTPGEHGLTRDASDPAIDALTTHETGCWGISPHNRAAPPAEGGTGRLLGRD